MSTELTGEYYTLLSDDEFVAWIVEMGHLSNREAHQIGSGFRQKTRMYSVADAVKIHAEVQPDCLFNRDILKSGKIWDFSDLPTKHAIVSWVPATLLGSTNKSTAEQKAMVASFKAEAKLPAWYEVSFGSANHVGGLALAHFKATGQNPFGNLYVRTDDCHTEGGTIGLGFSDREGLRCGYWDVGTEWYDNLGVFVVGVVKEL